MNRLETAGLGARLDRLPWGARHTSIMLALGAGWLFDSFEVQLFSTAIGPLGDTFGASVTERDGVLAVWLVGILLGAVAGGPLTDRFGRRRLFVLTLSWYAGFTVLTGLAPSLGVVYVLRFLAALGVGAEYAIVNAAIAEFIPARTRGRANVVVMSFWPMGAILAAVLAFLLLNTAAVGTSVSWRYLFLLGGLIALVVLVFRRRIPESPRWLASRGRHTEAERVVAGLETASGVTAGHGRNFAMPAAPPGRPVVRAALHELLTRYPGRLVLGSLLDLAEAFGYYGLFALLSVVVLPQVDISQREIPFFYILGNLGGLAGGLAMSLLIDRIGRRATVIGSYTASACAVVVLAVATATGDGGWVTAAFMLASAAGIAAWTTAYPTFTELFPTHLRGAGVGLSVGVGRVGAIAGALVLPGLATAIGAFVSYALVVAFWLVGAAAMAAFALRGGAEAARRSLEELAPEPPVSVAGGRA
ncbi:MFS transporter [Segeticoccus rhizosphaerae]|jgi:MFS family permease|uniref:MFS transporter n=1 Tax=Segeticoccus rhizosphaerae TaxID=1104777 RepID=UPI0010C11348|nr:MULTISPECIES: MFS transporter [Intrasporangiaceae]